MKLKLRDFGKRLKISVWIFLNYPWTEYSIITYRIQVVIFYLKTIDHSIVCYYLSDLLFFTCIYIMTPPFVYNTISHLKVWFIFSRVCTVLKIFISILHQNIDWSIRDEYACKPCLLLISLMTSSTEKNRTPEISFIVNVLYSKSRCCCLDQ